MSGGVIPDSHLLIIGHRGASAYAPENTHAAFQMAFDEAADGIELDVRLSRDGVPVVIHDASLGQDGARPGPSRLVRLGGTDGMLRRRVVQPPLPEARARILPIRAHPDARRGL